MEPPTQKPTDNPAYIVTSRLDNCNALLFGLPKNLLQKLQYVQNSAARLIMGTNKRDHILTVLKKLHWLPIENRIVFKILLLTLKLEQNWHLNIYVVV